MSEIWSSGNWDRLADNLAVVGPRLLDLAEVKTGDRVLDVGTGSGGSVAIPAAQRGAIVVGSDLTDAWFGAARRRAAEAGVTVEWVTGDAEALPFADAEFDAVFSTFGHMFAPDHERAAAEFERVCRPGGTIAFATWRPSGFLGQLLSLLQPASVLWGDEKHVTSLFRAHPTFEAGSIERPLEPGFVDKFAQSFGPLVEARRADPAHWPELRERVSELVDQNAGPAGLRSDYLLTTF